MTCRVQSTLCFAFLVLVAGLLVLSGGCFDASSNRPERGRNTKNDSGTVNSHDTLSLARKSDADTSRSSGMLNAAKLTTDVDTKQIEAATSMSSLWTLQSGMPSAIDWRTPEEKRAAAEEKIASRITEPESNVEAVEQTEEPRRLQTVENAAQHEEDDNPFAAVADAIAADAMVVEAAEDVIPLPSIDDVVDEVADNVMDESIWQQGEMIGHDSLEEIKITKPIAPFGGTITSDTSVVAPDAIEIDPDLVPTLSNVQTEDDDPFGFGTLDAADQFGQIFSDATTPQTTVPQTTTPAQQENDVFSGWEVDSGDTITTPRQPVERPVQPAQPTQQQPQTPIDDTIDNNLDSAIPLTPVEEHLVNEAKMSPVKLMESVELLYKLNKPLLVRRLLRQLKDVELSEEDYLQVSKRINPAILLRISLDPEYQPEGALVVRKIVEGTQNYFESLSTIENAMQTLLTGADREKSDATRIILSGGETSLEYLLERLAKTSDLAELSETMRLLLAMGESARSALQESLITTPQLGVRAARLLTQMGRSSDSRFLLPLMFDGRLSNEERREVAGMVQTLTRNVPNQEDAAVILYSLATNYFREKVPFMTDADNNVALWILREGNELPKFVTMPEADASRHFAEKFARYATCLDPQKPAYRQLWLAAFFELKGAKLGLDTPILEIDRQLKQEMLAGLSVDDVESALRFAMQQGKPIAARVAAELMGEIGDAEAVIYKRGSQSALVRAAGFSDRRVRFAALQSIMKLNPDRPYPGSSVVAQSLVYFTRATGKKRAVVVAPWVGDATSIAGLLEPLGYLPEVATMGREAMQLAINSADTELMMLDVRTPSSNVEFLVQDMRADNRTHDVPIAVLANGWVVSRAERANYSGNRITTSGNNDAKNRFVIGDDEFIVERDMMAKAERAAFGSKVAFAFPRPYDEASAKFVVESLLRQSGVQHVPPHIRLGEAKLSIQWVTAMYQQPNLYRFENIEQIAWDTLWEPELMPETLELVKRIPTANAQRWLTHIVSTAEFDIALRQAALDAFELNARNNGILIRGRVILDLYDMYNASGNEPIASQQTRGELLDVVEKYANYMQNIGFQK